MEHSGFELRQPIETYSDSESGRTIVLRHPGYQSEPSSEVETDEERSSAREPSPPRPAAKKKPPEREAVNVVLGIVYELDPEVPTRADLAAQFWEQHRIFKDKGGLPRHMRRRPIRMDDEEAMRHPRRQNGLLKMSLVEKSTVARSPDNVDEDEMLWPLDIYGMPIACCCRFCELFTGEVRGYITFLMFIFWLSLWSLVYGLISTSWVERSVAFATGVWLHRHTYPNGGPTTTRTITGYVVTYGTPRHYTAPTSVAISDYTILVEPTARSS